MSIRSGSFVLVAAFSLTVAGSTGVASSAPAHRPPPAPLARQHPDRVAPGPVTGLLVTAVGPRSVALSWVNPPDPDFHGVMVRRATGSNPPGSPTEGRLVRVTGHRATHLTDSRLRPGTTYSYALFAMDRHRNFSGATSTVVVTASGDTSTGVAGRVTDTAGQPLGRVQVRVLAAGEGEFLGLGETDRAGRYRVVGLSPGQVVVCFRPSRETRGQSPTGYRGECFRDQPLSWFGEGTPVLVSAGRITRGIDGSLPPGAAIAGRVTDEHGVGLAGVQVQACCDGNPAGDSTVTTTAADGTYRYISLEPADYTLCFYPQGVTTPAASGYLSECYDNKPDVSEATPVPAQAGLTRSGIDAALAVGGAVAGTVTDGSGAPVRGVFVEAANSQTLSPPVQTDAAGHFAVTGLPAGSYQVCFDGRGVVTAAAPYGYTNVCVGDFETGGVAVATGLVTTLDGHIGLAGAIGGHVTASDGTSLAGIGILLYDSSGFGELAAVTDETGHYLAPGLTPGVWQVCFDTGFDNPAYLSECYHDRTFAEGGTPVPVAAAARSTVDESLDPAAAIAGTVTATGGGPLTNVSVTVTGADGSSYFGWTGTDGTYTVGGLRSGEYTVCFDPTNVQGGAVAGYLAECFDDQPDIGTATPVAVSAPDTTRADAVLAEAGGIVGQVTGSDGAPLAGVAVSASPTSTAGFGFAITEADGSYRINGLRTDDYTVCFDTSSVHEPAPTGYVAECYDNLPFNFAGTPVSVTIGSVTSGIDAQLEVGGAVTGRVTNPAGDGVGDVFVWVRDPSFSTFGQFTFTTEDGGYVVAGVPAGDVTVCFEPPPVGGAHGTGYLSQCYNGLPEDPTAADLVSVTAGDTTSGIDAHLIDAPAG